MPEWPVEAVRSLRDRAYFDAERHRGDQVFSRGGADPRMVKFAQAFLKAAHEQKIPLRVFNIWRSPEAQLAYKRRGTSNAGPGQSPHNYGLAVDMIHAVRAWDLTRDEWDMLGVMGKEIARRQNLKVKWGGEFKSLYDPAHWELRDWKKEAAITA